MKPAPAQLGLGTVQFGSDYGISNKTGQTTKKEVLAILDFAKRHGIRFLDTAPAYGDSEKCLGEILSREDDFKIITKSIPLSPSMSPSRKAGALEYGYRRSLGHLRKDRLYGFLFHNSNDLLKDEMGLLWKSMEAIKKARLVQKIGVSIYSKDELESVMVRYPVELVQLPINVLDQRFLGENGLDRIKARGIEIHARSAFLQGLLLMNPAGLGPYFEAAKKNLRRFRDFSKNHGLSPLAAALGFLKQVPKIDVIICGVNNCIQLREISSTYLNYDQTLDFSSFAFNVERILNPSRWP
jgi:aryl-alcohol dehydrogenase-like predicted oxidoreductase